MQIQNNPNYSDIHDYSDSGLYYEGQNISDIKSSKVSLVKRKHR